MYRVLFSFHIAVLSLKGLVGRGFPLAVKSMAPSYFYRKQKENRTKGTSYLFDSHLLTEYIRQLEILVTALKQEVFFFFGYKCC